MFIKRGIFLSGDSDSAGAGTGSAPAQAPTHPAGASSAGTQNTDTPPASNEPSIPKARFDEVNGELKRLRQQVEAAERDRQQREDAAAKEQGKYRELAERHEAKVRELEPQVQATAAERDTYRTLILAQQDTAIKALPEPLKKLAPAVSDPPTLAEVNARATFLTNAAEAAASFGGAQTPRPGNPPGPRPVGSSAPTNDELKHSLLAHPRYAGF